MSNVNYIFLGLATNTEVDVDLCASTAAGVLPCHKTFQHPDVIISFPIENLFLGQARSECPQQTCLDGGDGSSASNSGAVEGKFEFHDDNRE